MKAARALLTLIVLLVLGCVAPSASATAYHAELGRRLQRDPLGYVDGPNLYEYVRSRAINSRDPMGLAMDVGIGPGTPCNPGSGGGGVIVPTGACGGVQPGVPGDPGGVDMNSCDACVAQAQASEVYQTIVSEMIRRGCKVPLASCEDCKPGVHDGWKSWFDPNTGNITICANRTPSCEYVQMLVIHELLHAYDQCQGKGNDGSCASCICGELRAYRFDGGCEDGGLRRTVPDPGPPEYLPKDEGSCLRHYVKKSCESQCGSDFDTTFNQMFSDKDCFPHSVVPPPVPVPLPPVIVPAGL